MLIGKQINTYVFFPEIYTKVISRYFQSFPRTWKRLIARIITEATVILYAFVR